MKTAKGCTTLEIISTPPHWKILLCPKFLKVISDFEYSIGVLTLTQDLGRIFIFFFAVGHNLWAGRFLQALHNIMMSNFELYTVFFQIAQSGNGIKAALAPLLVYLFELLGGVSKWIYGFYSNLFWSPPQDFSPINNVHKVSLCNEDFTSNTTLDITKGVLLLSSKNAWKFWEKQVAIKIVQEKEWGSWKVQSILDKYKDV